MENTRSSETSTDIYWNDGVSYHKVVHSLPYNNHKTAPMNPIARLMDSFHTLAQILQEYFNIISRELCSNLTGCKFFLVIFLVTIKRCSFSLRNSTWDNFDFWVVQVRLCTYKRNIEACFFNHLCSGKAIRITYTGRVTVVLFIQHAPYYIVICGPSGSTIFFHVIS